MPSILGDGGLFGGGLSILSIAKSTSSVGLSSNARAITEQFLSQTSSYGNSMFSTGTASLSVKDLQTQILALRASMPKDALARDLQPLDNTVPASKTVGTKVNKSA